MGTTDLGSGVQSSRGKGPIGSMKLQGLQGATVSAALEFDDQAHSKTRDSVWSTGRKVPIEHVLQASHFDSTRNGNAKSPEISARAPQGWGGATTESGGSQSQIREGRKSPTDGIRLYVKKDEGGEEAAMDVCTACGKNVLAGSRFCNYCGGNQKKEIVSMQFHAAMEGLQDGVQTPFYPSTPRDLQCLLDPPHEEAATHVGNKSSVQVSHPKHATLNGRMYGSFSPMELPEHESYMLQCLNCFKFTQIRGSALNGMLADISSSQSSLGMHMIRNETGMLVPQVPAVLQAYVTCSKCGMTNPVSGHRLNQLIINQVALGQDNAEADEVESDGSPGRISFSLDPFLEPPQMQMRSPGSATKSRKKPRVEALDRAKERTNAGPPGSDRDSASSEYTRKARPSSSTQEQPKDHSQHSAIISNDTEKNGSSEHTREARPSYSTQEQPKDHSQHSAMTSNGSEKKPTDSGRRSPAGLPRSRSKSPNRQPREKALDLNSLTDNDSFFRKAQGKAKSGAQVQKRQSFTKLIASAQMLQDSVKEEMFSRWDFVFRQGFVVNKLFKSNVLKHWIIQMKFEKNIEMILLLSLLNQWLSPFLSEQSDAGVHSYGEEISYFRSLARGTPEIIDFILEGTFSFSQDTGENSDRSAVTCMLIHLYQTRQIARSSMSLSEGVQWYYRPALICWLVRFSTAAERSLTQRLLRSVVEQRQFTWFERRFTRNTLFCEMSEHGSL